LVGGAGPLVEREGRRCRGFLPLWVQRQAGPLRLGRWLPGSLGLRGGPFRTDDREIVRVGAWPTAKGAGAILVVAARSPRWHRSRLAASGRACMEMWRSGVRVGFEHRRLGVHANHPGCLRMLWGRFHVSWQLDGDPPDLVGGRALESRCSVRSRRCPCPALAEGAGGRVGSGAGCPGGLSRWRRTR
jgi:hypothetical protein